VLPRDQRKSEQFRITIPIETLIVTLVAIALALIILSYAGQLAVRAFDWHPERDIVQFVNLDRERNLPTTFSTLLFLGCSLSLAGIAILKRLAGDRWARHWALLSFVFVVLAWDEIAEIHERFIEPMRRAFDLQGLLFFGWIVPAAIVVLLVGLAYLRFVFALDRSTRNLIIASGVIFLTGALLFEAIGGWYYERIEQSTDMVYVTITTVEETLEIAGLILFLHTLLNYLSKMLPGGRIEVSGEPGTIWVDAVSADAGGIPSENGQ
jgi:hypothetical protein